MNNTKSAEDIICKEFSVAEETYGMATSLYGICSKKQNSHYFRIASPKISERMRISFHGNAKAKTFAINYQLAAAMQQMGCGNTDDATLAGFLDLPATWSVITSHLQQVEKVMGPLQIRMADESMENALADEIKCIKKYGTLEHHECTIQGHAHPPLPLVKGSYGK